MHVWDGGESWNQLFGDCKASVLLSDWCHILAEWWVMTLSASVVMRDTPGPISTSKRKALQQVRFGSNAWMSSFIGQRGWFLLVSILDKLAHVRITPELDREKQFWDQCCILFQWFIVLFRFLLKGQWFFTIYGVSDGLRSIHKTCICIVLVQFISHVAQLANAVHYHISHDKFSVPCWEVGEDLGICRDWLDATPPQVPLHGHESALGRHITPRGVDRESIHPGWGASTFLLKLTNELWWW